MSNAVDYLIKEASHIEQYIKLEKLGLYETAEIAAHKGKMIVDRLRSLRSIGAARGFPTKSIRYSNE